MLALIRGTVQQCEENGVIIDTGSIGLFVYTTKDTLFSLGNATGQEAQLHTYLAVRENALELYGFIEKEELAFFKLLLSVSGVGPKSALSILSLAPVETLKQSIAKKDITYLTKVSGLGKKTAEKIVLELKDKIATTDIGHNSGDVDVISALQELGYTLTDAREAVQNIEEDIEGMNERLKSALKFLGK